MGRYQTLVMFLGLAAIWGTAFMAIKAGLAYFPPVLFAALRYDIAAVVMLSIAIFATDRPIPQGRSEWFAVGVGSLFLIALYHALLFIGQQAVTAALAAVVVGLGPVLTTIFAGVILPSERLGRISVIGMILGFIGVGILAQPAPGDLFTSNVIATILILLATAAFAFGSVVIRRSDATLPIETLEAWSMIIGAIILHIISKIILGERTSDIIWSLEAIGALLYLALGASAIGFLLYFVLLDRLGPVEINLVSYVVPIFAAIAGWIWLAESIDVRTVIGFVIIFTGFCLIKWQRIKDEYLLGLTWFRRYV